MIACQDRVFDEHRLEAITHWTAQPHFWFAVGLPAAVSLMIAIRNREEVVRNAGVWVAGTMLTIASAYADIRPLLGLPRDPFGVYAVPVFLLAYLAAGRYRVANPAFCVAGTFASLLAADLVIFGHRLIVGAPGAFEALAGIGAGKPLDGLLLAPLGGWAAASVGGALQLRGVPMRLFRSRIEKRPDQA